MKNNNIRRIGTDLYIFDPFEEFDENPIFTKSRV
tara:strand:+ start:429 stop:530 length:102 start_codon:yes stop_codon:yes gene_type:complete